MKNKKLFGSIAVLAIAAMAAFNMNINADENGLSNVSLDNVEALANETAFESEKCYQTVSYSSELGDTYAKDAKYCGNTCKRVKAHSWSGSC
jgi:hypothetical protein